MRIDHRWLRTGVGRAGIVVCVLVGTLTLGAGAGSMSPHHSFLGGPWEVVVKMGHEGQALRLPVSVRDEGKPQALDGVVPVMGTPLKVRLDRYVPDLQWKAVPVDDPNGGAVARVSFRGESLEQDLWLSAREVTKQSISSHIGGVTIRELPPGESSAEALRQLGESNAVGVLLVTPPGAKAAVAYPVSPGTGVALPGTTWKVSVLRYVPHYSINRETREVTNASEKPVNPAVEIKIDGGEREYRQWLWSKFPSSPHRRLSLPFPVRFLDFALEPQAGHYLLAVAQGVPPKVLYLQDGKRRTAQAEFGRRLAFKDERYSFALEELRFGASVETRWKNGSENLLHPAVVATIVQGDKQEEAVLEQGKPYHHRTASGTLVVLYRRVP